MGTLRGSRPGRRKGGSTDTACGQTFRSKDLVRTTGSHILAMVRVFGYDRFGEEGSWTGHQDHAQYQALVRNETVERSSFAYDKSQEVLWSGCSENALRQAVVCRETVAGGATS